MLKSLYIAIIDNAVGGTGVNAESKQISRKAVSGQQGDTAGKVTFNTEGEAVIQLKAGETLTIIGLPTGTTYTVVESADDAYTLTEKQND